MTFKLRDICITCQGLKPNVYLLEFFKVKFPYCKFFFLYEVNSNMYSVFLYLQSICCAFVASSVKFLTNKGNCQQTLKLKISVLLSGVVMKKS